MNTTPTPVDPISKIPKEVQSYLLHLAWRSILNGLRHRGPALPPKDLPFPEMLEQVRATFVTLEKNGELRGCIGVLTPFRSLAHDVCHNAYAAAFEDPRFLPLQEKELESLRCQISVLTPPQPITFQNEADLLEQIVPFRDGLILEYGVHQGTFLPSVWEHLPNPKDFWNQLKRKAQLTGNTFSTDMKVSRYFTESFSGFFQMS